MIADDHDLIRRGLRNLLGSQAGWQIVAEACNGGEAVRKAVLTKPDVVVLDLYMPVLTGVEAAVQIRRHLPQTAIIILTMQDSPLLRQHALDQGVSAFLLKTAADETLIDAILSAVPQAESIRLNQRVSQQRLTNREWEVMKLLSGGSTSRDISVLLGISIRTVESHRTNINTKCGFRTVADLVRFTLSSQGSSCATVTA